MPQSSSITPTLVQESKPQIINISIMVDYPTHFDELASWLSTVDAQNITFVLWTESQDAVLNNRTRIDILQAHGEIIPRIPYAQTLNQTDRIKLIDTTLDKFTAALGHQPRGVFDFIPDTFCADYLASKGVIFYQGYCFDQWRIDMMSMRGGLQMPYYASDQNILVPSDRSDGAIVFPHASWDWVSSFTFTHNLQLHPLNLISRIYHDNSTAQDYFLEMINRTMQNSRPFGYLMVQFEWEWCYGEGITPSIATMLNALTARPYDFQSCTQTAQWFKATYPAGTPTYRLDFTSPYDGQSIEWYSDTDCRVARMNGSVVSYVDYLNQTADRYLTEQDTIDWGRPTSDTNGLDDSLTFTIDALGGAPDRHPVATAPYPYAGDLSEFQRTYESASKNAPSGA